MQERHLYEYAVIRLVPRVERDEFINVGLIVFSKRTKFLKCRLHIDKNKIQAMAPFIDLEACLNSLNAFEIIVSGNKNGGLIAGFDIPDRFRWLTAVRSSCIQTSRPHVGLSLDMDMTFNKLFEELVM